MLFDLFSGIQAPNYVANTGITEVIFPDANNAATLGANLLTHPDPIVPAALSSAGQSFWQTRTQVIELLQGGVGIAMYQQINAVSGEQLGFVIAVFRTNDWVETCLFERDLLGSFRVTLKEIDGSMVYQSAPSSTAASGVVASILVDVAGLPWRQDLFPTSDYMQASQNHLEDYWPYLGILLVVLLAASIRTLLLKQPSLRDSKEKYRLLAVIQSDFVVKVNADNEFLYASPNYCKTLGKPESEIFGTLLVLLVHEDDQALAKQFLNSITPADPHSYHERRAFTKDGWRWSNTGIFDADNKLQPIAAVGRDITDMKKLKDDIAHNQKMQANGEIANGKTHDFNNLLQIMMGNIEFLINDRAIDKADSSLLEQIHKSLL